MTGPGLFKRFKRVKLVKRVKWVKWVKCAITGGDIWGLDSNPNPNPNPIRGLGSDLFKRVRWCGLPLMIINLGLG